MIIKRNMLLTPGVSVFLCVTAMISPALAEFPVNISGGKHDRPAVSLMGSKSGFVVVWKDGTNKDVMARRYDKKGAAVSGEISVASSGDDEKDPSVCVAEDGESVVAWHNKTSEKIFVQKYDADGSPVGSAIGSGSLTTTNFGFETIANNPISGVNNQQIATQVVLPEDGTVDSITAYIDGSGSDVRYAIYSDNSGEPDVLLAQTSNPDAPDGWGWWTIDLPDVALTAGTYWLALAFDRSDQQLDRTETGGQLRIASYDGERFGFRSPWGSSSMSLPKKLSIYATLAQPDTLDALPSLGMADDGSFVIAWSDTGTKDIFAQRHDAAGSALGGRISVATSADEEKSSCVAAADDGSFVVAWENKTAQDVFAQRYDAGGNALGGQIQVTSSSDEEKDPSIGMAGDGSFVVAWENKTARDVYAQRYDASGSALGGAIQVTSSGEEEKEPSIGMADDGSFVVAWENKTAQDVFAQRYDSGGSALGAAIQVTTSSDEDKRPDIAVQPRGRFVVVWSNKIDRDNEDIYGQLYYRDGSEASEWKTEWRVSKWVEITAP